MTITEQKETGRLVLRVEGRLDTVTSPQLEQRLGDSLGEIQELVLDFTSLEYISSAGLRVLLAAHKRMKRQEGDLVVRVVNENVREVFTITGFIDMLHIE